jgi:hypothetical protein
MEGQRCTSRGTVQVGYGEGKAEDVSEQGVQGDGAEREFGNT